MGLLSVQGLITFLALCCIVLTACICTLLAIISGDNALDATRTANTHALQLSKSSSDAALGDTRTSDAQAIDSCFGTATSSILALTTSFLTGTAEQVSSSLRATLATNARLVGIQYDTHSSVVPPETTDTGAYLDSQSTAMWATHRAFSKAGVTALMIFTFTNKARIVFEETGTVNNPPDGLHHIMFSRSNGVRGTYQWGTAYHFGLNFTLDPVWDAPERLPGGGYESDSCRQTDGQNISPITGKTCAWNAMRGCRPGRYKETGGVIDDGACYRATEAEDLDIVKLAKIFWPFHQPRFSPLIPLNAYMGIALVSTWADSFGRKLGMYMMGIDVRSVSNFLASITIGGPEARFRLFVTVEDNWLSRALPLPSLAQKDNIVAVSHGNSSTFYWESEGLRTYVSGTFDKGYWRQRPRHVRVASDPLIRGTARHILTNVNGSFAALFGQLVSFRMNSTLAGGGWTEEVPGPVQLYPWGDNDFGPARNRSMPYINGYLGEEESTLDPLPGYARDGEEYFCSVTQLRSDPTGRPAVGRNDKETGQTEWILTMIIDREYVLGATDRRQQQTRQEIDEANSNITAKVEAADREVQKKIQLSDEKVQDDLDEDRLILYCVVGGVAIVLMFLSCIFASRIVAPIRELNWEMAQVATMKLEVVDNEKPLSGLQEVKEMQSSFLRMVANLKEYRSYMPASCLVDDDDEEEEDNVADAAAASKRSSDDEGAAKAKVMRANESSAQLSNMSGHSSKQSMQQQSQAIEKAKVGLGVGLVKKGAAFMSVNVIDFCLLSKVAPIQNIINDHQRYLTALLATTKAMKGLPDLFNGDRYYASFNAVRPCVQSKVQAAKCSLESHKAAKEAISTSTTDSAVSVACSGGDVYCGNIGVDGMKKFCALGVPSSLVHVAEQQNATWKTSVLADSRVKADAESSMLIRLMHVIPTYKGQVTRLYEIIELKKMDEDEWMYQLEAAEKANPTIRFSEAVEAAFAGDLQKARQLLRDDPHQTLQHTIKLDAWKSV